LKQLGPEKEKRVCLQLLNKWTRERRLLLKMKRDKVVVWKSSLFFVKKRFFAEGRAWDIMKR